MILRRSSASMWFCTVMLDIFLVDLILSYGPDLKSSFQMQSQCQAQKCSTRRSLFLKHRGVDNYSSMPKIILCECGHFSVKMKQSLYFTIPDEYIHFIWRDLEKRRGKRVHWWIQILFVILTLHKKQGFLCKPLPASNRDRLQIYALRRLYSIACFCRRGWIYVELVCTDSKYGFLLL